MLVKNILLIIWDKYHNENSTDVGHTLSLYIRLSTRLFPSNLLEFSNSQHVVGVRLLPYCLRPQCEVMALDQGEKAYTRLDRRRKLAMHTTCSRQSTCTGWQAEKEESMHAKLNEGVPLH